MALSIEGLVLLVIKSFLRVRCAPLRPASGSLVWLRRQYATLSLIVFCDKIMTAVRPNDGRSPNDSEVQLREA